MKTLHEAWTEWHASDPPRARPGPGDSVEELASVLMRILEARREGLIAPGYVGGLVSVAIHEWKAPVSQRCISDEALRTLEGGGDRNALIQEHDPPVAFYRDQILDNREIGYGLILEYLRGMKVTLVTRRENQVLDKQKLRSIRPPNAYERDSIGIARNPYPAEDRCTEHVRRQLYPRRRALRGVAT